MKAHTKKIILFTLLLCASLPTKAQVMTLEEVLREIEEHNPMLREYESKAQALTEYSEGARSWMAPMIGVGTFMKPYRPNEAMHENERGAWMLSLEQDIPNPAKLKTNREYLASRASIEEHNKAQQYNTLRSEAKTLYYQWLVSERKLKVLQQNEAMMELMLKLARIRYPYNQGSLGNIYKAEGRISEVQNMIEMVQGDIEESAIRLKSLMNTSKNFTIDTTASPQFDFSIFSQDTISFASQRSDLKQINQTIEVMRLSQKAQRVNILPDFKIRFDHMEPIGEMPRQFSAMAMISIPIAPWSSKMYRAEVRGMQYEIEAMQKGREAIINESKGMISSMASQLARMKQQLNNYESKIIPALRKNYQTVMLAYEENREQLPMVIDAWEALNMSELEYLEKTQTYYNMIVSYEKELEK